MIRVRVSPRKMSLFLTLRLSHKKAARISIRKCYRVRISGSYRDFFHLTFQNSNLVLYRDYFFSICLLNL